MNYMNYIQMLKNIFLITSIFIVNNALAGEGKKLTLTTENYFSTNQACQSYEEIEGKKYCVKKSLIPLNSCGEQSDWPCMDAEGCLGITQFIKE